MVNIPDIIGGVKETQEEIIKNIPSSEDIHHIIDAGKENIIGSGSIITEINKLKNAYTELPINMISNTMKASAQLLTVQPVAATLTVLKGAISALGDIAKIGISPIPTSIAAIKTTLETAKVAAKLPYTAPVKGFHVVNRWCDKLLNNAQVIPKAVEGTVGKVVDTVVPNVASRTSST